MEGGSRQAVEKSPQEIEDGIESTEMVTWDPFTVFPKEIYCKIFDRLIDPIDKQNFMNAHVKWYDLFKDKRTHFLFQEVFKEVSKVDETCRIVSSDIRDYRLVCQDWNKAVQSNFQLSASNFQFDYDGEASRGDHALWIKNLQFSWLRVEDLEKDLRKFSVTHPCARNPFFSRKICLSTTSFNGNFRLVGRCRAAVDTLLKKYGRYIWHCSIATTLDAVALRVTAKWLRLMPELKTLGLYNASRRLPKLVELELLEEIWDMELPQPELNKLVVLKSMDLPSVVFNKFFGSLKELEKIQIRLAREDEESVLQDFVMTAKREILKEAFFTLKGLEDIEYLGSGESFVNLKKLDLIFQNYNEQIEEARSWAEWGMTFKILEEKFPELEELSVSLPKAVLDVDKETALNQSLEATLNLPKLKKLWITTPNLASIDFLLPCIALDELKVVLEHRNFTEDWTSLGRKEKVTFNVDLSTLWESNVWDEFPMLKVLEVEASFGGSKDCYRYEKAGDERKYKMVSVPYDFGTFDMMM